MEGNVHSKELAAYLLNHHSEQLSSTILALDTRLHYSLYVDFAEIMDDNPSLSQFIFAKPTVYLPFFDEAAVWAQKVILADLKQCENANVKENIHVRINISVSPLECPGMSHEWNSEVEGDSAFIYIPNEDKELTEANISSTRWALLINILVIWKKPFLYK